MSLPRMWGGEHSAIYMAVVAEEKPENRNKTIIISSKHLPNTLLRHEEDETQDQFLRGVHMV